MKSLGKKLVEVMKSAETVPKNGRNEFHKYDYALEADILKAVRGKLAELGVLLLTSVEGASKDGDITEVTTKHTFIDTDSGETADVKGYGQGQDKGDKGGYKAITGALKYLITKTFLIPTGDDPEKDEPESAPNGKAKKPGSNGKPINGTPAEPPPKQQTRSPNESTPHQQDRIKKTAEELGLNVDKDILSKMRISWPPNRQNAERIIKRLNELKLAKK